MSFYYSNGWRIAFFDDDRRRSALPRRAFCHDDETLLDFIRRAGGVKGSDTRVYLEAALKRHHGEVTLLLTEQQYDVLRMLRRA
jgi:hypothetical protein